ncbi:MAG: MMPL family transporter [Dehalococcoidia bacterium]|nr:MMPL family transporter [Dehalococcoidia bacterium]
MNTNLPMLERWGRFAAAHRWQIVAAWVVALVLFAGLARAVSQGTISSLQIPGAESQEGADLLKAAFPERAGDYGDVVLKSSSRLDSAENRAVIDTLVTEIRALGGVTSVVSPFAPGSGLLSADGTAGIARIQFAQPADDVSSSLVSEVEARMAGARSQGLQVEFGGPVAVAQEHEGPNESTVLGLLAALLILYLLFRTLVPTLLPVGTAMFGLAVGFMGVFSLTALVDLSKFAPNISAMLGLGVGIDYALFIVARHRENLSRGMAVPESIGLALGTAGKSVVFAGAVVVTSLLGLSFMGLPFVRWIGVAAAIMVTVAVLVAMTLLPALLAIAGTRVLRLRGARASQASAHHRESVWHRLGYAIMRRPYLYFGLSSVILAALAVPALDIRLGSADAGNNPSSSTTRRAYDITAEAFGPGANGPLQVILDGGAPESVTSLRAAAGQLPGVASVGQPMTSADGRITIFSVIPKSAPQDSATADLVHTLRNETIPGAVDSGTGVYVAGTTARYIDIADRIGSRLPLFFAIVISVSFVLLTMVFRSLVIALKAALMNLLSIGAAYGVVVAVFEWGWGLSLTGADRTGPVESFLPMMLFAVLFGLSMDYEVFLVSRIREEYLRTGDNAHSVAEGLSSTASVITAAATIMIVVFLSFVMNDQRVVKEFGVGLAVAVFVDATVVRLVLVPATMQLMGHWNWWLPAWLDRALPQISIEGSPHSEVATVAE